MSQTEARAIRQAPSFIRAAVTATSVLLLLAVLGIVLFTMLRSPLKDDVAWLLYVARRWMAGRELYVDVVEINPPLIVWISAIPIWLAGVLGIDAQFTAIPFFVAAVLACAWWTASLLRGSGKLFEDRLPVFAAIGTVLLVVPAGDLGQREHLLVAAILPYLALFARSLDGERTVPRDALIAGALAGLGCALKPRYAGVFVVLEGLVVLRGMNPFRTMPLVAATTMLAYAGLVALFCPAYLRRAVPLALALYGATDVPLRHLVADSLRLMFGQAVALLLWWHRRHRAPEGNLMLTLVVFAITSTAICFMDGKDWFYHRLPATIATVLALLCWAASALMHRRAATRGAYLPVVGRRRRGRRVPGRGIPAAGTAGGARGGAGAGHGGEAGAADPPAACTHLHRLLRMDRAGVPGGQQYRRRLGVALRFDVGAEGRTLARPLRCRRGQGVADPPLGRARLHRRLPRHRRGRYARRRGQLCRCAERLRPGLRARLVALPPDRVVRRPGGVPPRRHGMHRSVGGGGSAAGIDSR